MSDVMLFSFLFLMGDPFAIGIVTLVGIGRVLKRLSP